MPASSRSGVPATISMPVIVIAIAIVVPRSGSSATSAQMTSASTPIGFASSFTVRGGRLRAASTAAVKTTTASFANSDAWMVIGPAAIQRSAPFTRMPIPGTFTRTSPMRAASIRNGPATRRCRYEIRAAPAMQTTPGQRVAPLAHERPERVVALDDGDAARRAVDHDQAERDEAEGQQEQQVVLDVARAARCAAGAGAAAWAADQAAPAASCARRRNVSPRSS